MVGSALWRLFTARGYFNLIGKDSNHLDLRDSNATELFISKEKPDVIINAAAKVGGILANDQYPYEFLMDNMLIQNNLIGLAHKYDIDKLIFFGSSCIYPKLAAQPLKEEYLLKGPLEETNQWFAIAKISGVKLVEALRKQFGRDYVVIMPTNLYGPGDNYDLKKSHVLPAMMRKFVTAKRNNLSSVELWGTGNPRREFLHVDDLAEACFHILLKKNEHSMINVGTGEDISIKELAEMIKKVTGFKGKLIWNTNKPDGTPRKLMEVSKIKNKGWKPKIDLLEGITSVYKMTSGLNWN
uniref:GDP-L-fucose synthase n=1 Tax=uncultured Flavobacteriia bacterium TaxID=212695 RepID=H6REN6_9BACT|nr:GDP-fucose synthetase [uncultured Flavobacteriia bacterium]